MLWFFAKKIKKPPYFHWRLRTGLRSSDLYSSGAVLILSTALIRTSIALALALLPCLRSKLAIFRKNKATRSFKLVVGDVGVIT